MPGVHVAANQEAGRLLAAAAVIRRHAGALRYHPARGTVARAGPEWQAFLTDLQESLGRIQAWIPTLETAATSPDTSDAAERDVHAAAERLKVQRDLLRAALDVLDRVLAQPERVPLDAPYGLGAPRRVHPGAQATWVAERAEALARELVTLAVLKENLAIGLPQTIR